jgi:hypothetical protein
MLFWLGNGALATARALMRAATSGLSWIGPKVLGLGRWLFAFVALSLSRLTAGIGRFGRRLHDGAGRQRSRLVSRPRPKAKVPERKRTPGLDPSRLQQAIFIRLRAEHDRLQARIHAMDHHYQQRASHLGRNADAREWVELRKLALNARRLFETQERQVLGQAQPRGEAASPSLSAGEERPLEPHIHPLQAGHAIYEAPAMLTRHRRA